MSSVDTFSTGGSAPASSSYDVLHIFLDWRTTRNSYESGQLVPVRSDLSGGGCYEEWLAGS